MTVHGQNRQKSGIKKVCAEPFTIKTITFNVRHDNVYESNMYTYVINWFDKINGQEKFEACETWLVNWYTLSENMTTMCGLYVLTK